MVHGDPDFAAGLFSMRTVALPCVTMPVCVGGPMNGSLGCSPTCGGVLTPWEPTTTASFPPMKTDVARFWIIGAVNGIGGPGCGAPEAGFGIMWIEHVPFARSPITTAGAPTSVP